MQRRSRGGFTLIELLIVIAIIATFVFLISGIVNYFSAAGKVPELKGVVNDYANVIPDATEKQLEQTLLTQEAETSNQIVVLTVKSLGGKTPEEFAEEVFTTWELGEAEKDNGVLILNATSERKIRIEVGHGLEGALTDSLAAQIIRDEITPRFKENDFAGGFVAGTDAVILAIKGEYVAKAGAGAGGEIPLWGIILIIFIILIIMIVGGGVSGSGGSNYSSSSGSWGGGSGGGYSGGGGGTGGGGATGSY
jgi:uncharacterized protein